MHHAYGSFLYFLCFLKLMMSDIQKLNIASPSSIILFYTDVRPRFPSVEKHWLCLCGQCKDYCITFT